MTTPVDMPRLLARLSWPTLSDSAIRSIRTEFSAHTQVLFYQTHSWMAKPHGRDHHAQITTGGLSSES
jgi:hypothetical protein